MSGSAPVALKVHEDLRFVFSACRTRRARKEHACDNCGEPIRADERYLDTGELKGNGFSTLRYCRTCAASDDETIQARFTAKRERERNDE